MALLLAVGIGAIGLILAPGLQFYFDVTPKAVVLLMGTAVLVVWQMWRKGDAAPSAPPIQRLFTIVLVCNGLSLALSTVLSRNPALSLFGTAWRRFGAVEEGAVLLFAWLAARHAGGYPERVRTILRGVAISGIVAASYGIAQYFGWDPILPKSAYHIGEGIWTIVRPPGTLGYASYFATWLVTSAFLGAALAAMETRSLWRGAAWTSAALSVTALFLNGTRAALVGLLAGGAVWIWGRGFRHGRRVLAGVAVLAIATAALYVSPAGLQLRSRARWFAEDPWGGGRRWLWPDSLFMASRRLPAGYGPEVFSAAFPAYESVRLARQLPDFSYESPHNILLDALIAQGIPGLLALCGLAWIGFYAARKSRHPAALLLAAALAAGLASQQFTVFIMPTALLLFTTVALAVALATVQPAAATPRWTGKAAAMSTAAILLVVAVRLAAADFALEKTRRALASGQVNAAAASFAWYDRVRLPGSSAHLWYSRESVKAAQAAHDPVVRMKALAQYGFAALRATQIDEEPFNAWYNAAQYYAVRNDAAGVERSLRAAIAARPHWFKPHWTLAQVLRLENRLPEADREASLATELDGGTHPEVMATWEEIHKTITPPLHK